MDTLKMLIIFSTFALFSAGVWAEKVVTLTNGEWPPYVSENLKHYGVASHIVSEAFALEGITVKYVFLPWKRAYADAENGKNNGSLVWSRGTDREESFYFSDTVITGQSVFFHLKSFSFNWQSYDDLVDLAIGGSLGYVYRIQDNPRIKIERASSDDLNFKKLLAGRIDIFPSDVDAGYSTINAHLTPEKANLITHHPRAYNVAFYHLILSKKIDKNIQYIKAFNLGLKKLKERGRYEQFIEDSRKGKYSLSH